jgi:hypothetical protein
VRPRSVEAPFKSFIRPKESTSHLNAPTCRQRLRPETYSLNYPFPLNRPSSTSRIIPVDRYAKNHVTGTLLRVLLSSSTLRLNRTWKRIYMQSTETT